MDKETLFESAIASVNHISLAKNIMCDCCNGDRDSINDQYCNCPFCSWVEDEYNGKVQWICRLSNDIGILERIIHNLKKE